MYLLNVTSLERIYLHIGFTGHAMPNAMPAISFMLAVLVQHDCGDRRCPQRRGAGVQRGAARASAAAVVHPQLPPGDVCVGAHLGAPAHVRCLPLQPVVNCQAFVLMQVTERINVSTKHDIYLPKIKRCELTEVYVDIALLGGMYSEEVDSDGRPIISYPAHVISLCRS